MMTVLKGHCNDQNIKIIDWLHFITESLKICILVSLVDSL